MRLIATESVTDHTPPARRRASARRRLLDCAGRLAATRSAPADAVRVGSVGQRAVLSRIRDVITHPSQPLERVHGLEVPPLEGIRPRAVDDGFLAVEVSYDRERSSRADRQLADSLRRRARRPDGSRVFYVGRGVARQVPPSQLDDISPTSAASPAPK
jgi:hypothetical protein